MVEVVAPEAPLASDYLQDPCEDRVVREVTPALQAHLAGNRGFKGGRIHFDLIKSFIAGGGKLAKDCLAALLLRTTYIL